MQRCTWSGDRLADSDFDFDLSRWIFLILSILGLRQWLVRIMPQSLVLAVGAGIGLFIACASPVHCRLPLSLIPLAVT